MHVAEQIQSTASATRQPPQMRTVYAGKRFKGDTSITLKRGSLSLVIRRDHRGFTADLRSGRIGQIAFAVGDENLTRIQTWSDGSTSVWLNSACFELRAEEVARVTALVSQGIAENAIEGGAA